jgi:superfamily II DNA or RNA helicase
MISILVTNQQPQTDSNVPQGALDLFQQYCLAQYGQVYPLFQHQAEVIRYVLANLEVFLVAGTAAGKTLAIATPLFHKLATRCIRKVLFMYPTIALMEDQRRVMDGLARLTGLSLPGGTAMEIGLIRGGMSRTELIEALNKPVILATPDAIYWFFRKNVKYSSLLIYGLALLDEVVIDEAHLFNGIMLQNLFHLKQRMQLLSERIGKRSRWHILTATPTPELKLLTQGTEVSGQSKCGDVVVTFHAPIPPSSDGNKHETSAQRMVTAVDEVLTGGAQKVLTVFNAADIAHRTYTQVRGSQRLTLPMDLLWKFGRVRWGEFEQWLAQETIPIETVSEIGAWLRHQFPLYLKSVPAGVRTSLEAEALMRCLSQLLEEYQGGFRRLTILALKDERRDLHEALLATMGTTSRSSRLVWDAIATIVPAGAGPSGMLRALDSWVELTIAAVERALTSDTLAVTSPDFPEIRMLLQNAGVGKALAQLLVHALSSLVRLPEQEAGILDPSASRLRGLKDQLIGFAALPHIVQNPARYAVLAQHIRSALARGQLKVEARHITTWKNSGIPVLLYTGKMTRAERDGLIDAFALLPQAILISTPAAEVGVDFDADTLVTEECDGNAFLQRFGRVGRRSGIQGNVIVFLKDGQTYARLANRAQPSMSRTAFSDLIAHPTTGIFSRRLFAGRSLYVETIHWLINQQLGEVGEWLNQRMFSQDLAHLAGKLQAAGLGFGFGLRATLPTISLKYGAGSADPFYLLRVVENEDLILSDSPFELARSEMLYEEFLWQKPFWQAITVDLRAALEDSQVLFWWENGGFHLQSGYGIAADYARVLELTAGQYGKLYREHLVHLEQQIKQNLEGLLTSLRERNPASPIVRIGGALPLLFEPHARIILGQGTVSLLRLDRDGVTIPVEDHLGNPLVLSEQMWLLLYGYDRQQAQALLRDVSAEKLEEIIYDWWSLERSNGKYLFLLDRSAGACFAVYQRLVNHVTT